MRDALVNKIPARPAECLCCGAEPRLYTFNHEENNNKEKVLIPCEIRILNSEEFETELKIN